MFVVLGITIVLGAVLAGFSMAGGNIHALIHPSEIVTIGGAALGALVASNSPRVLKDLVKGLVTVVKGSPYNKETCSQVFGVLYEAFRIARKDGILAWESILSGADRAQFFAKYPRIAANHHLEQFLCAALTTAADGADSKEIMELLESEIQTLEKEHNEVCEALSRTADALPGFGIVAAVLGIVITMQSINGPVEQIGHSVGAALVGTFLGILLSYGIIGPVASRMHSIGAEESALLRNISVAVSIYASGASPRVALEKMRRGVASDWRPSSQELDDVFKKADMATAA